MQTYRTNTGHDVKSGTIEDAINETIKNLVVVAGEKLACAMRVQSAKRFQIPRHGVEAVRLILEPDLPEFIAKLIPTLPTVESSFSITDKDPTGDQIEIENPRPDSDAFVYHGEWGVIANQHCHFQAGLGALKDGRDPADIFVTGLTTPTPGVTRGLIMSKGAICGSVNARATKFI
jgi:hypothetical protein